jgi:two-component system, OmpR family, alkaline phosphatase synthesis response regulator PhoP
MKKILVVEDDKFLNNAYKIKFTKAGYEVKVATDGEEAIKILADFTPDVILLDLIMPIKDGFATLEEIRANPSWKNIPVIIASNLGQQEDIQRGIGLGATDFIIKSDMSMENLMVKVTQVLEKATGGGAATASPAASTEAAPQPAPVANPTAPEVEKPAA